VTEREIDSPTWALVVNGQGAIPENFSAFFEQLPSQLRAAQKLGVTPLEHSVVLIVSNEDEVTNTDITETIVTAEALKPVWVGHKEYLEFIEKAGFTPHTAGGSWNRLAQQYFILNYGGRTGYQPEIVQAARNRFFPVQFKDLEVTDFKHYESAQLDVRSLKVLTDYLDARIARLGHPSILSRLMGGNVGPKMLGAWKAAVEHWVPTE